MAKDLKKLKFYCVIQSLIKSENSLIKALLKPHITSSNSIFDSMVSKVDDLDLKWSLILTPHRILKPER